MSKRSPRVTLAMPVYNGENYLAKAIVSILSQYYGDFELVITDNASTDRTEEIARDFAARDRRIRYFRNARNVGAAANYNRGFSLATGEYLKWCAHDDLISENFVSTCVGVLDEDETLSLVFARTVGIDDLGHTTQPVGHETPALLDHDPTRRFMDAITLGGTCFPIFGLFRMSALRRSTLHRPYYGSDRGLIAEMALLGRFQRTPEATFFNREHLDRSINIGDKLARSRWQTGASSRGAAAEHINLARHLFEIAGRHPDIASPWKLRANLAGHTLKRRQLGRYCLELASIISPSAGRWMRTAFSTRTTASFDVSS